MSKKNKENEEIIEENNDKELSKKELYDLNKKKKDKEREKLKNNNKNKKGGKNKKTYQTSIIGRIFAIVMLILMVGSIIATISYYFR